MARALKKWGERREVVECFFSLLLSFAKDSPSSSCEKTILRNMSHGVIIRVCMGI